MQYFRIIKIIFSICSKALGFSLIELKKNNNCIKNIYITVENETLKVAKLHKKI